MAQIIKRGLNTWQIRVFLGKNEAGKKLFHTKTIHGLKREAVAYAEEFNQKLKAGYAGSTITTLKDLWESYLQVKKTSITPNTLYTFKSRWRNYWQPIENTLLSEITTLYIQRYLDISSKKSLMQYKHALTPLKACLSQGVKWGLIPNNPCSNLLLPPDTAKEREILTPEEIQAFLNVCQGSKYGLWFRLVLTAGVRTGEALALCWDCVNFENTTITIKRGLITENNTIKEGTKTASSYRTIKIDSITCEALKRAHEARINNLVFPGSIPEKPITRSVLTREFRRLLTSANITKQIRLYDLRHSCASYLIHCGLPVRAISDRLGHNNPYTTLKTYTHSLPEQEARITEIFSEL